MGSGYNETKVNDNISLSARKRQLDILRKGMDENENDWDDFIDGALFTTNTNVSSTTKFSSFIMFGRQTRLPFDVEKFVQQAERRMLQYIDKMATTRNVMVSQGRKQHNHSSGEAKQGSNERGKQA